MKLLIAEDDPFLRRLLESLVARLGYEAIAVANGTDALRHLLRDCEVRIALLDWVMPGMDGTDVLRSIRAKQEIEQPYVVLVTGRTQSEDIVQGLDLGADDYITKPFEPIELEARLRSARRMVEARESLKQKVRELAQALEDVQHLQGILPICMHCKSIRDDQKSWRKLEEYVSAHSGARFSHGICDRCMQEHHS